MENKMIIPIVLAADRFYALPLAVTLASIAANKKPGSIFKIHILDGGLDATDKQKLESFCSDEITVDFLEVDNEKFAAFPVKRYLKMTTYYRLIAAEMLNYAKIIYLDCDIIVNCNLADLYKIDLRDQVIAAVRERSEVYIKKYFFRPISRYFNAGVLLIDTVKWREQNILKRAGDFIKDNIAKIKYDDQDVLNHLLENGWREIDGTFNFQLNMHQAGDNGKSINILHFVGRRKPWHYLYRNQYKQYFLRYLRLSPYADYRYPDKNLKTFTQKYFLEPVFVFFKKIVKRIAPRFLFKILTNIFRHFCYLRDSR
jgi:lipopolysaccharide biosynthesis glycosyltransferase